MELTWYGRTCVRLKGKDAVVVADPYQAVVGPTGRGITGEIVTYSHPDDAPLPKAKGKPSRDGSTLLPSSLEESFVLDGPGEYEVRHVLITGVRTWRDDERGARRGRNLAFNAGTAAAYGLSKEEALASITLNAAKIMGVADRTGSIEVGKDANIVVSEGDILDMKSSNVTMALIQGRKIDLTDKHKLLNQRFEEKYELNKGKKGF